MEQLKEQQEVMQLNKSNEIIKEIWRLSEKNIDEVKKTNRIYGSQYGMFASIPIICRVEECKYKDVCLIDKDKREKGIRCPMEISAILSRYVQWCSHFGIDIKTDILSKEDLVDATLIKDLVNVEIQMMRAENKIAISGDFITETLVDIDRKCKPYFGDTVSPETNFLMVLQDKKIKILNQLNATRKDKAKDMKSSPSEEAIKIFQQIKELEREKNTITISDINFEEDK